MLDQQETMRLIDLAKLGDTTAKEILIVENSRLIKSIVARFRNKYNEYDDLYQIGSIGFLKAIDNFDKTFNVKFSTYAVPMITGEIKRFLRDDGYVKISRSIKVLAYKISKFVENYRNKYNDEPKIEEIAKEFCVEENDVLLALDSSKLPVSIYEKNDDQNEKSKSVMDKLSDGKTTDDMIDRLMLKDIINSLDERDKKIILLRYFRDKTQSEIAKELNISQVQISRLEVKILEKMKGKMLTKI